MTQQNPVQTADSHVHALRQQTLLIHFTNKGQKPSIIMSDGRPTVAMLTDAKQTVRTQHNKRQIWTLIYGDVLPVQQVHGIIKSYFDYPEQWTPVDLSALNIPQRKGKMR